MNSSTCTAVSARCWGCPMPKRKKVGLRDRWLALRDELQALLEDETTVPLDLDVWEDSVREGRLTKSQSERLKGIVRMAKKAVGGKPQLREARAKKALRLALPAAADYPPPPAGTRVAVIRCKHGWYDGDRLGVYIGDMQVRSDDGCLLEINHIRDIYKV